MDPSPQTRSIDVAGEYRATFDLLAAGSGADTELVARIRQLLSLERPDPTLVDDIEAMLVGNPLSGQSTKALVLCLQASMAREPDRAHELLEQGVEAARIDGDALQLHTALISLAALDCAAGDTVRAVDRSTEARKALAAVDWSRAPLSERNVSHLKAHLQGHLHWLDGLIALRATPPDLDGAEEQFRRGIIVARDLPIEASMRLLYADIQLARRKPQAAAAALRRIRHLSRDPAERAEATIKLVGCAMASGDLIGARAVLEDAPEEGDRRHAALRQGLSAAIAVEDNITDDDVRAIVEAAHALGADEAALLRATAAEALLAAGRPRQARAHAAEGLRLLSDANGVASLAVRLRVALSRAELARGRSSEAGEQARVALDLARDHDLAGLCLYACHHLTDALSAQARFSEARRVWAELLRAAVERDEVGTQVEALLGLARAYAGLGDENQAVALWRRALRQIDDASISAETVVQLFEISPHTIDASDVAFIEDARADAAASGARQLEDRATALLVRGHFELGEVDLAERMARQLVAGGDGRRRRLEIATAYRLLADVLAGKGRTDEQVLRETMAAGDASGDVWLRLRARLELGNWELAHGRWKEAAALLAGAADLSRETLVQGASLRHATQQSDVLHEIHTMLAFAHHLLGDPRGSIEALETGARRWPGRRCSCHGERPVMRRLRLSAPPMLNARMCTGSSGRPGSPVI